MGCSGWGLYNGVSSVEVSGWGVLFGLFIIVSIGLRFTVEEVCLERLGDELCDRRLSALCGVVAGNYVDYVAARRLSNVAVLTRDGTMTDLI